MALRALLEERVASAQAAGAPRRISVALDGGGATPPSTAMPLLLQRAVGNLLDNAIDFSPDGGRIEVALRQRGAAASRSACATTAPASPTTPTTRCSRSSIRSRGPHSQRKSTGLGLPFVREIAELHGGRVTLRNADGGGALAVLSLPGGMRLSVGPAAHSWHRRA